MKMNITIGPHPAAARDPETGLALEDGEGVPIPLLADHQGIYVNGQCVAYVKIDPEGKRRWPVGFCRHCPDSVANEIMRQASPLLYGDSDASFNIPEEPEEEGEEDEYDE